MSTAISIIEAVIGFSLLVLVHELGHFLVAKWIGVRVEAFSIGFGPFLKKKWGETEYRLSLVPFGGYVKMAGEEPKPDKKPEPHEFYAKSVGRRCLVFAAGAAMNLIFGFVLFSSAYMVGVPFPPSVVGNVIPGSAAWKAGLLRGDVIVGIDNLSPPVDFEDLKTSVILARGGTGVRLVLERDGKRIVKVVYPEYDTELGLQSAGILRLNKTVIGPRPESAPRSESADEPDPDLLFKAGLAPGDQVTDVWVAAAAGEAAEKRIEVETPEEFENAILESRGNPVRIGFLRGGVAQAPVTVTPQQVQEPPWIGIRWGSNRVKAIRRDSWAGKAGFLKGDVVTEVGGKRARSESEVFEALDANRAAPIAVTVLRGGSPAPGAADGRAVELTVPARPGDEPARAALAFVWPFVVSRCLPGYPAEEAGLQPGDAIISVNGAELKEPSDFHAIMVKAKGEPLELVLLRDGQEMRKTVTPGRRRLILVPWRLETDTIGAGFLGSLRLGGRKTWQWILRVPATIRGLVRGSVSTRNLSGPLAIGYFTYAAAKGGLGQLLYTLALFSVNFGIVNLLPVPVLDGGHLLFALFEKLRGKPLSERIRAAATYVGLALIVMLLLVAFRNDIRILFFG